MENVIWFIIFPIIVYTLEHQLKSAPGAPQMGRSVDPCPESFNNQ